MYAPRLDPRLGGNDYKKHYWHPWGNLNMNFRLKYYIKSEVTQSCLTLHNPMDCSQPASSVYGIFQARVLEWAAISFSRGSPDPGIEPMSPALAGGFFFFFFLTTGPEAGGWSYKP